MRVWAILLHSSKYQRLMMVDAETEHEALGMAFSQLKKILEDRAEGETVRDYTVDMTANRVVRSESEKMVKMVADSSSTGLSFDEQIRKIRR